MIDNYSSTSNRNRLNFIRYPNTTALVEPRLGGYVSSNASRSSPAATEISNAGYSSTGRTSEHCNTAQILQQLHKNGNGAPSPFESNIMNTNTLVTPPLNVGVENSQLDSHPYVSHPMLPSTGNVNVSAYIAGLRYGLAMSSKQQQQPANDIDEPAAMASVSLNNVMENNELLFMNSSVGAKNNDLMKQPLQCFPVGTGNPAMESLATLAPFAIGTSFTTEDGSSPYRTAPPTTHRGKKIKMCRMESCMTPAAKRTPYCAQHSGPRRCEHEGCKKGAQGRTRFCIAHGGGRRCIHAFCNKGARDSKFCAAHGGGKRCFVKDCSKSAVGGSNMCTAHGGGKRCQHQGCTKSAQSSTPFCVKHGGGRKCVVEGCNKVARGRTQMCMVHGAPLVGVKKDTNIGNASKSNLIMNSNVNMQGTVAAMQPTLFC